MAESESTGDGVLAASGRNSAVGSAPGALSARQLVPAVSATTFLVLVTFTAAVPTVGATAESLHASPSEQTWILSGMSVGLAAALLFAGTVADSYGRRTVLAAGTVALAAASALNAIAPDMSVLIGARVLEGVAGAGVLAGGLGLIGHEVPAGAARTRATAVWGAMVGAGIAVGPVASSALADLASWRTIWWAIVIAAVAVAPWIARLPERRPRGRGRLDTSGAASFAGSMACLTAGLTAGRGGWTKPATIMLLAAGVALLALFVALERRGSQTLIDLKLFRRPLFLASAMGALMTGLALIALMSFLPLVAQRALGQSPLASAGTLAIWSATSWLVAMQTHRLPARLSSPARLAAGFVLCAAGAAALSGVEAGATWLRLAPGLLVAGIGSGVVNAALGRLAVESVPLDQTAMGSGANNTARYLGGAAGIALVVAIVTGGDDMPGAVGLLHGWNTAALVGAALCLVAALLAAGCHRLAANDSTSSQANQATRGATEWPLSAA